MLNKLIVVIISQYSQVISMYNLTSHNAVCQLYPSKTGWAGGESLPHIGWLLFFQLHSDSLLQEVIVKSTTELVTFLCQVLLLPVIV